MLPSGYNAGQYNSNVKKYKNRYNKLNFINKNVCKSPKISTKLYCP